MRLLGWMLLATAAWGGAKRAPNNLQNGESKHENQEKLHNGSGEWRKIFSDATPNDLRIIWLGNLQQNSTDFEETIVSEINDFRDGYKSTFKNRSIITSKNEMKGKLQNTSLLGLPVTLTKESTEISTHNMKNKRRESSKNNLESGFKTRFRRQKRWFVAEPTSPLSGPSALLNIEYIYKQQEEWASNALEELLFHLDARNGHQVTIHVQSSNILSPTQRSLHAAAHNIGAPVVSLAHDFLKEGTRMRETRSKGLVHVISVRADFVGSENMLGVWKILSQFHSTNVIGIFIIVCLDYVNAPIHFVITTLASVRKIIGTPDIIFLGVASNPHVFIPIHYDLTYPKYSFYMAPLWKFREHNLYRFFRRWDTRNRVGRLDAYSLCYFSKTLFLDSVPQRRWTVPPEIRLKKLLTELGVKFIMQTEVYPETSADEPWVGCLDPVNLGEMCRQKGDFALTYVAAPVRQVDVVGVVRAAPFGAWGRAMLSPVGGGLWAGVAAAVFHLIAHDHRTRSKASSVGACVASLVLAYVLRVILPGDATVPSHGGDLDSLDEAVSALDTFYAEVRWADAVWSDDQDDVMRRLASKLEVPEAEDFLEMVVHNRTLDDSGVGE